MGLRRRDRTSPWSQVGPSISGDRDPKQRVPNDGGGQC